LRLAEARERAFLRAERHSRLVGILRKTLPVVAVLVLACYFISSSLSVTVGDLTANISGLEVSGGNLRMVNPKLQGADKKNGQYVVSADYADQDVKNPKVVKLHAIKAELSNPSGSWSRMQAVRGVFDSQAERLVMQDKITVATSSGVTGELKHATLDMKTQTLRSHRPVYFQLTNGSVRANALTLQSSKHRLIFRGKVMVRIIREAKEGDDALPKPKAKVPPLAPKAEGVESQGSAGPASAVNPL
jgi:lipopolysaccharide export system protein LptC